MEYHDHWHLPLSATALCPHDLSFEPRNMKHLSLSLVLFALFTLYFNYMKMTGSINAHSAHILPKTPKLIAQHPHGRLGSKDGPRLLNAPLCGQWNPSNYMSI